LKSAGLSYGSNGNAARFIRPVEDRAGRTDALCLVRFLIYANGACLQSNTGRIFALLSVNWIAGLSLAP
jgi:hypothetical protein